MSVQEGENRSKPDYQHPLFQPEMRHVPPLATPARRQTIPRKPVTPKEPATTFEEILPTVNTSNEPHGQQAASHITLPTTLHRSPTPPRQSKPSSRTARFFARFRSSPKDSESHVSRSGSQSRPLSQSQILPQSESAPPPDTKKKTTSHSSNQNLALPQSSAVERRQQSRERRAQGKQIKANLREAERQERARTQWLGGVAWGFDPDAGMRRTQEDQQPQQQGKPHHRKRSDKDVRRAWCAPVPASFMSPSPAPGVGGGGSVEPGRRARLASDNSSIAGPSTQVRPSNPRRDMSISSMSSTQSMGSGFEEVHLGVEAGGPGREGQYEYGMLRSRQVQQARNSESSGRP